MHSLSSKDGARPRRPIRSRASTIVSPIAAFAALALVALAAPVRAHVDWTRVNDVDPDTLGIYHFSDEAADAGLVQPTHPCMDGCLGLVIGAPGGDPMTLVHDTPKAIFDPHAARFASAQTLDSTCSVAADGDVTIEFWFKWDASRAASSFEVGLRSGAKIRVTRDEANPAGDQFGVQGTHGDYRSSPGFTNWAVVGDEEASFGEWRHIGLTIHSTGVSFDETLAHDVYNPGTVARLYYNGHATGDAPHTIDLGGFQVHADSRLRVNNLSGVAYVDEFTVWKRDWSDNGANLAPFADGRGSGVCPPPTPSPTPSPSPTESPSPTVSPSPTASPSPTPEPTESPSPTPPPTATPEPTDPPTATPTASPTPTLSPTPEETATPEPSATPSPTATPEITPSPTASPTPAPPRLVNISTRGFVGTGSEVMIPGFIVLGGNKNVLVSGIGPDLANFGVTGVLADPMLALMEGQNIRQSNDDWMTSLDSALISTSGHAPNDPREAAVIDDLPPGEYTAILSGRDGGTGVGLVQVFDLGGPGVLRNISTRLSVATGDRVMIAGVIVEGADPKTLLVRGLGPTLAEFGVPNVLANPELGVFGEGQVALAANDDWRDGDEAGVLATGLQPPNDAEPAIVVTLPPGSYTAILSGVGGTAGTGLIEVYEVATPAEPTGATAN